VLHPNTVFVLGAAVSREVGFPLGGLLRDRVAEVLRARNRDDVVTYALLEGHGQAIWGAIDQLVAALPIHPSIDNLIEFHRENTHLIHAAKVGIAAAILREERSSRLFQQLSDGRAMPLEHENTYGRLLSLIIRGCSRENLAEAFERVTFVNFNYDRSLEFYLWRALNEHMGISGPEASELVAVIKVHHPYGSIGPLFGQTSHGYGQRLDPLTLISIADSIRTFSEGIDSQSGLVIKEAIAEAERLVFLGCAHHPQNMRLLAPKRPMRAEAVYGTVYGPAPVDEHVNPSMAEFLIPTIQAFKSNIQQWQMDATAGSRHFSENQLRIEASTSLQLISRYGNEWTDLRAA
jgi:hypothetical protein